MVYGLQLKVDKCTLSNVNFAIHVENETDIGISIP